MNEKAVEMSFAWIFGLVVGAVILFLAIYFASQLIDSESYKVTTKTGKELAGLLDPLQTTIEQGKTESIELTTESRIYTSCNKEGDFGNTVIQFSEKFGFKNKWSALGGDVLTQNAYLFAEDRIDVNAHGKVYFFIKPFEMPFKVADMTMMYSKQYCFVNAPSDIEREVENLGQNANLINAIDINSCSENSVVVCFDILDDKCDVKVNTNIQRVIKNNEELVYVDETIYATIFSSKANYDCNMKRIMMKLEKVSELYKEKARFMAQRGCDSGLYGDMLSLNNQAKSFDKVTSIQMDLIKNTADSIKNKNEDLGCQLF